MDNVETNVPEAPAEQETLLFRQMVGRTIYEVAVHFNQAGTETMADKVGRLILNDMRQI